MDTITPDPKVYKVFNAIRNVEGGNYNDRSGDNGTSAGAFQWNNGKVKLKEGDIPNNFKNMALGLGLNPNDFSKANQNKVAYKQIEKWKNDGLQPEEIAALWNGAKKDASGKYTYNNPEYGVKFRNALNISQSTTQPISQPTEPKKDFLQKATDVATAIFPGKQVGEAIGTLGGYLTTPKEQKQYYDISAPTPTQVVGDVAQGALMVAPGLGAVGKASQLGKVAGVGEKVFGKTLPAVQTAKTALGRLGQGTALNAGFGLSGGLAKGETSAPELARSTAIGVGTGFLAGTAGEILGKVGQWLPKRMLPFKVTDKTADYALTKKLGNPKNMLTRSDSEINNLGNQLGNILKQKKYQGITVQGKDIYPRMIEELPNSSIVKDPELLVKKLKEYAGTEDALVDKLFSPQGLTLPELQKLNSNIGDNIYKSVFDTAVTKTGKQIGNKFYHAVGDAIRAIAKEDNIGNVYDSLSKEYLLNNSLRRYVNKVGGKAALSLNDLVAFDVGGLPTAIARRVVGSPTLNIKTAGLISGLGKETTKETMRRGVLPYLFRQTNTSQTSSK